MPRITECMATKIFTTPHGSRLYGFAHAGSDVDTFTVTDSRSRKVSQSVQGDDDRCVVGVHRFLELAMGGSHQSVEALYSPLKMWADTDSARQWRPLLESVRVGGGEVSAKFERTIRKFSHGNFKQRRHAARLSLHLMEIRQCGRIVNVRLQPAQVEWCARVAEQHQGQDLAVILGVS